MFFVRLETYCPSSFFQLSFTLVLLSKCLEKSSYTTHPFGTYSCFLASKMEHYSRSTLDHRAATVTRLPPRRWLSSKKKERVTTFCQRSEARAQCFLTTRSLVLHNELHHQYKNLFLEKSNRVIPFTCRAFKLILKALSWLLTISSTT